MDPRGKWTYVESAPAPDPSVTAIQNVVTPEPDPAVLDALHGDGDFDDEPEPPEHPGGDWANPEAYLSYDEVDSTTIADDGRPS
jgi:hypothetical protein